MSFAVSSKSLVNKGDVAFSPQLLLKPYKSHKLKTDPWSKHHVKVPSFQGSRTAYVHSPRAKIVKENSSLPVE